MKYRNNEDDTLKVAHLPFDQALKRKVVVRNVPDDEYVGRVYVQGAPEEVIRLCTFMHNV